MKLGKRLRQIVQFIEHPYDHIWDCCCDHGLIGMHLYQARLATNLHFVDIVKPLINQLKLEISRHLPQDKRDQFNFYCMDAADISLSNHGTHLIIIAGVGGERVASMVKAILDKNPDAKLEFLLCPVHHNYILRQSLIADGLKLINEKIIEENRRYYEVIHVARDGTYPLCEVGSRMWQTGNPMHSEYLEKTLRHFQHKAKNGDLFYRRILAAYQSIEY